MTETRTLDSYAPQTGEYRCMTAAELATWMEAAANVRNGALQPCFDCPDWFAALAQAEGCCDREPKVTGRPGYPVSEERRAQMRRAAKRYRARQKRRDRTRVWNATLRADVEAIRLARAHAKGYTVRDEYSVPIAHTAQRPADRLYSGRRGVDVPEYRRNA